MKVIVNGTTEVKTLSIISPETSTDYIQDFIGGAEGFDDHDEDGIYHCDADVFAWWERVVSDNQALENRIHDLCGQYGSERVHAVVADAGYVDLEDHAAWVNQCLDGHFGAVSE